ncbi:MAG: exopolysaccharide Pel transporter PelG [Magnetococcales bacterium]|nr:exopolysaccharide Pel transporter PelG [Magnetococcales bacterium]
MAGIGFILRRLAQKDDLLSVALSYSYAFIITSGPWILTSLTVFGALVIGSSFISNDAKETFRIIIIYNFSFSLVFSGPIIMVTTRILSDMIYQKQVTEATGLLVGSLSVLLGGQSLLAIPFYLQTSLSSMEILQSIIGYLLVSGVWLVTVFISALKGYRTIIIAFFIGLLLATILSGVLSIQYGLLGMLTGFNIGISVILFSMLARILSEYQYPVRHPFKFLLKIPPYWMLAISGFLNNISGWADKWIMWFSPHGQRLSCGLISYPEYDSAMFLAYLTIIPSMAAFMVSTETRFFEKYLMFFKSIYEHHPYSDIDNQRRALQEDIMHSGRNLFILQGTITATIILTSQPMFDFFGISYLELSMFHFGALGVFFHVMTLFILTILTYFDLRKPVVALNALYLFFNVIFTVLSIYFGMPYYGFGYLAASLIVFSAAYITLFHHLERLPYYVFIKNNPSVR